MTAVSAVVNIAMVTAMTTRPNIIHAMAKRRPLILNGALSPYLLRWWTQSWILVSCLISLVNQHGTLHVHKAANRGCFRNNCVLCQAGKTCQWSCTVPNIIKREMTFFDLSFLFLFSLLFSFLLQPVFLTGKVKGAENLLTFPSWWYDRHG